MICTSRVITIRKGVSLIDEPIILYRGDYEVEVKFTIVNSKFKFLYKTSVIESEEAAYGQMAILDPHGGMIFSDVNECIEGAVSFVITKEMINELTEVGLYSFQIRLFDKEKLSRATIPPIEFGIEIREPIVSEDTTEIIDDALVGYSIARATKITEEPVGPTFDDDGLYNKTNWVVGDRITPDKLNKIEEGINGIGYNGIIEHENLNRIINSNYNILDTTKANKTDVANTNDRIDKVEANMYDEDWYKPENAITGTTLGQDGIPESYDAPNYEAFYDWILNPLMEANPEYITKQVLGKDHSNTYDIYRYDFTPPNYEKTITLFSCLHGNEYTSFFGLCRFLKELCEKTSEPNLSYLRNKIRLVVVPIANPWGFVNGQRQNVNGVDLNRNFDYRWDDYLSDKGLEGAIYYKGTAPFSEKESEICRDLLASISDLVASIDFHTITTIEAEKILYYPRFQDNALTALSDVVKKFNYGQNRAIFSSSAVPTLTNYACYTHGIHGCNPEWNNACYEPNGERDSVNMTKWVEWAGNVILALARNSKKSGYKPAQPFLKTIYYEPDAQLVEEDGYRMSYKGYRIVNTTQEDPDMMMNTMNISKYEFDLDQQYLVTADGWVRITAEEDATVNFQPMLYQRYSPEQRFSDVNEERRFEMILNVKAGQEYFIPFKATLLGFHTNYNEDTPDNYNPDISHRSEKVCFRLRAYTDVTSSAYISGFTVSFTGIPSDKGIGLTIEKITESTTVEEYPLRIPQEDLDD